MTMDFEQLTRRSWSIWRVPLIVSVLGNLEINNIENVRKNCERFKFCSKKSYFQKLKKIQKNSFFLKTQKKIFFFNFLFFFLKLLFVAVSAGKFSVPVTNSPISIVSKFPVFQFKKCRNPEEYDKKFKIPAAPTDGKQKHVRFQEPEKPMKKTKKSKKIKGKVEEKRSYYSKIHRNVSFYRNFNKN